jgi:hypothetical protein
MNAVMSNMARRSPLLTPKRGLFEKHLKVGPACGTVTPPSV